MRRNPSLATTVVSLPYQDSDLILESMARSPRDESLREAIQRIASYTGGDVYRIKNETLLRIAEYVTNNFDDARYASRFLSSIDPDLGIWCNCACLRYAIRLRPDREDVCIYNTIEKVEAHIQEKITTDQLLRVKCEGKNNAFDAAFWLRGLAMYSGEEYKTSTIPIVTSLSARFAANDIAIWDTEITRIVNLMSYGGMERVSKSVLKMLKVFIGVIAEAVMTFPM